jgi:hypothetical protein
VRVAIERLDEPQRARAQRRLVGVDLQGTVTREVPDPLEPRAQPDHERKEDEDGSEPLSSVADRAEQSSKSYRHRTPSVASAPGITTADLLDRDDRI